jgi:two-component system, response regulator
MSDEQIETKNMKQVVPNVASVILLVEDNPDDVELTLRAFKKNDFQHEVVVVRDGAEAVDYLFATGPYAERSPTEVPALILLDLKLPKLNGLDVLRRIRDGEMTKRVPVVILTTSDDDTDVISGYDLGVNSYIRKPVGFDVFMETVRQLGLYWLTMNKNPPK